LIRNRIAASTCLQECTTSSGGGGGGNGGGGNSNPTTCGNVTFQINLDLFGSETTWEILNPAGVAIEKGGPYVDKTLGQKIERKACLPYGCYKLKIYDKVGDGICCKYGDGSFTLLDGNNVEITKGGIFGSVSVNDFCVKSPDTNPPPTPTTCTNIDFSKYTPISFGGSQDGGTATVPDGGKTLIIQNNAWKAVALNYTITSKTFLEFEFRSTILGEIHGIGFDDDENISSPFTFQLWGTQTWGIPDFRNYEGNGQWKKYTIPVGKFYTGVVNRLFFAADKDATPFSSESQFRNVRIYEETPCPAFSDPIIESHHGTGVVPTAFPPKVNVYPNPTSDIARFSLTNWPTGQYKVSVFDALGKRILNDYPLTIGSNRAWEWQINTSNWASGMYFYTIENDQTRQSGKVLISRNN